MSYCYTYFSACVYGVKYRNSLFFCTMAYIYIYTKHFNIYI